MTIDQMQQFCRAVNHKERKSIIDTIETCHPITVTDIMVRVRIEQSRVSLSLNILRKSEIVTGTRSGKHIFYSINPKYYEICKKIMDI